jgi:hypothetical protein
MRGCAWLTGIDRHALHASVCEQAGVACEALFKVEPSRSRRLYLFSSLRYYKLKVYNIHSRADTAQADKLGGLWCFGGDRGGRPGGRGDILLALEPGMSVMDVSITHPSGVANLRAAATTYGAAAARRDREKRRTYGQLEPNGYPFISFSVETYAQAGHQLSRTARLEGEGGKAQG